VTCSSPRSGVADYCLRVSRDAFTIPMARVGCKRCHRQFATTDFVKDLSSLQMLQQIMDIGRVFGDGTMDSVPDSRDARRRSSANQRDLLLHCSRSHDARFVAPFAG
jgi:hypothetical protein